MADRPADRPGSPLSLLERDPLFGGASRAALSSLLGAAEPVGWEDGEAIYRRGEPAESLGENTLLPRRGDEVGLDLVARDFGPGFAEALGGLPLGEWSGPVASGIGLHLVRVERRTPASMPPLDEVRTAVAREFEADRRRRALEESYRRLRAEYDVVVEAAPATPNAQGDGS